MAMNKKFTVVTPSYNQSEFICDNLKSVRKQEHPNVEQWVIDGGSNDGTTEILKRFKQQAKNDEDYELEWVSERDRGQSHAINKGFDRAEGEIIGWLNSDDMYFDVGTLQAAEKAFRKSGAKIVYGDDVLVGPDNTLLRIDHKYDYSRERLLRSCYICQPALFFHREVIEKHWLDESLEYVMDYEFWLRLSEEYKFYHLDRILAADRNHPNRKMITNRQALIPERESVQKAHGQTFGPGYWLGRVADKAYSAWNRLRGVLTAKKTIQRKDLAFPLRVDTREDVFWHQLFSNNKDLI